MEDKKVSYQTVDDYIMQCTPEIQNILQNIRNVIKEEAPEVKEKISYQMPTFIFHGILVHFAAYQKHIGFYPAPSGIEQFEQDLAEYKHAKGSIQFPLHKPIPYDLIRRIVRFRVSENLQISQENPKSKK